VFRKLKEYKYFVENQRKKKIECINTDGKGEHANDSFPLFGTTMFSTLHSIIE
jgi:hypothetical protein